MGAYLSHPKTDKASTDELNDLLIVGASSMQGWRNSQEDAHNAILNFDANTSFFAVYDGHGGAEVAQYCADKLPEFLKELQSYQNGKFEQALKDSFLGFDKSLLEPQVVNILKILAGERNFVDTEDAEAMEDDEDFEDLEELHEEGHLPLDELLGKYEGHPDMPELMRLKDNAVQNSKPQSPYLRGRRAAAIAADAANKAAMDPDAKPKGSSTSMGAAVSADASTASITKSELDGPSSSKSNITKIDTQEPEDDSTVSSSSSSGSKTNNNSTSNNIGTVVETTAQTALNGADAVNPVLTNASKGYEQNGSVTSSETKAEKADVSTSSSGIEKDLLTTEDATVSASSDSEDVKQNGRVASSSAGTLKSIENSDISSTSKEAEKAMKVVNEGEEDEDDTDYVAENAVIQHLLEEQESSEEDLEDNDGEIEEDDEDDDDDEEDDDDDDDDDDPNELDEERLANDQFCANMIEEPGKDSGCTAVVALLHGRDLYVANAGDSRCVVCREGNAIEMSLDHKPEDEEESKRIGKAGGRVTVDGRVNGGLNLSRAIGDHAYKMNADLPAEQQMISALPDIKKLIINPDDEFLILACDGIWNYMSSDEVVEFVSLRIKDETKKLSQICEELFDNCLAPNTMGDGTGCDNMTAVIVKFKPKMYEMPTKINPAETEDMVLNLHEAKRIKRAASPESPDETLKEVENENKCKRLKTDEVEDRSAKTKTTTTTTSVNNDITASSSTPTSIEQKECDSVNNASNNEANAREGLVASST